MGRKGVDCTKMKRRKESDVLVYLFNDILRRRSEGECSLIGLRSKQINIEIKGIQWRRSRAG